MATEKQKAVARKIVENHGSVSGAMKDAGYKNNTAKNPKNLTNSKGWQELMDQYYPDDQVARIQKGLLKAKILRIMTFDYEFDDKLIKRIIRASGGTTVTIKTYDPVERKPKNGKKRKPIKGYKKVYYTTPDQKIVDSALDMIFKTKGRYITNIKVDDKRKYRSFTDEQLRRIANGESSENFE